VSAESLEARRLMAVDGLAGEPAGIAAAAIASEPVAATRGFECPAALAQIVRSPQLPSPIMADYNLDGRFTSEDLVSYFHIRDYLPNSEMSEEIDLVESMQWTPYEGDALRDSTHPCAVYEIAANNMTKNVTETTMPSEDGQRIKQSSLQIAIAGRPSYQAAMQYDDEGRLSTYTLDYYRVRANSLYSRMEIQYDQAGRPQDQRTWIYGEDGGLQRITASSVYYEESTVYRSTRVEYFDEQSERALSSVRYFSELTKESAYETTRYTAGAPSLVVRSRYDHAGRALDPTPMTDPNFWTSQHGPRSSRPAYLQELEDTYRATFATYAAQYAEVRRMNRLPSQENLSQIIEGLELPRQEGNDLVRLNLYFDLALDLAESIERQDFGALRQRYSSWIDPETGDWSQGFKDYVAAEGLALPFPALTIVDSTDELSAGERDALVSRYRQIVGDDPAAYFRATYSRPEVHVRDLLESMRYVKANIKVAEYRWLDKFPAFERIVAPDHPDRELLGLRAGVLLTGWYFYRQNPDGSYDRSDVDPEVLEKRVNESLTNEDEFYAMNLEDWELDGPPEVVDANLAKLKRVADLIHEYNPNLLIGYYRLLPRRRPYAAYAGADSEQYRHWQEENNHIAAALEESVDVIFPSVYTLHVDQFSKTTRELWSMYATELINESRRLGGGKPVIPYVATYYHPNGGRNPKGWQMVEPDLLLYQLTLLSTLADGAVIYDDMHRTWQDHENADLDEAIVLFRQAVDRDVVPQLLAYYDDLTEKHRPELLEKLELETALIAIRDELLVATNNKDARRVAALVREIGLLEYQIRNKIDLWPQVKAFLNEIL
jgi:hypothetical protein